ncbi:MAG: metallophosphoesterase family protein [Acidobacteriota bacterium]|nr:metallophosphoesterase family protein [Acidobacteriota bacterium]
MQTLVVSDLHIGAGHGRMRLDDPGAVAALAERIAGVDRLVLLGDVVELRERPIQDALAAAARVLPQLVAGLGAGRELVLVPGNHDHQLQVAPEALSALVGLLSAGGAAVRHEYPGVWLRDDVYAQHGHYLDRHTTTPAFERLAAGAMARFIKLPLSAMSSPEDYERVLAPVYAWMYSISQNGDGEVDAAEGGGSTRLLKRMRQARTLERFALETGVRALVAAVSRTGLGPLTGDVSDAQLRRASLVAFGEVLSVLGLEPRYALFGHTHRAGPLAHDRPEEWTTAAGTQLINTGCWVNEHFSIEHAFENPYRPGFAVELADDPAVPPRLVNLLDD